MSRAKTRRANGDGSIYKRADGAFEVRISVPGGKRRKRIIRGTYADARRALRDLQQDAEAGLVVPNKITVAGWAALWLDEQRQAAQAGIGLAPRTLAFYEAVLRNYVLPHVGDRALVSLSVADVEAMVRSIAKSGRTIQAARTTLSRLLKAAQARGLLARNVANLASVPRCRRRAVRSLTPEQARALLDAAHGEPLEGPVLLMLLLGLRRGEILGLHWEDVDLVQGRLTVRRTLQRIDGRLVLGPTKTERSNRVLPLPPAIVRLLHEMPRSDGFVFTRPSGEPLDPDILTRQVRALGSSIGIAVHPHLLRHTAASLALDAGVPLPSVSEHLGHTSTAVTAAIYAHGVRPDMGSAVSSVVGC